MCEQTESFALINNDGRDSDPKEFKSLYNLNPNFTNSLKSNEKLNEMTEKQKKNCSDDDGSYALH